MDLRPIFRVVECRIGVSSECARFHDREWAEAFACRLNAEGNGTVSYIITEEFNNDIRLRPHYELVRHQPGTSSVIAQLLDRGQAEMFAVELGQPELMAGISYSVRSMPAAHLRRR